MDHVQQHHYGTQFYPSSTWMPPKGRDPALEIYIKQVRTDVERQLDSTNKKRCHDNLPPYQRKALRELRQRPDIVIKPANKGFVVVVLRKDDYIKETERQLNNHAHYEKLRPHTAIHVGDEEVRGIYVFREIDRLPHTSTPTDS